MVPLPPRQTRRTLLLLPLAMASSPGLAQSLPLAVYLGARDCPACLVWERDTLPPWQRSADYAALRFTMLKSDRIAEAMADRWWPAALHPLRNAILADLAARNQNWATPLFAIVWPNGQTRYGFGAEGFEDAVRRPVARWLRPAS